MRTLIIGLGAQKAGTTWLFRQLAKSKQFSPGLCKEYHLFDYLHLGRQEVRNNAGKRINNFKEGDSSINYDQKLELFESFYVDTGNYYNYIDQLLQEDRSFTVDITPSYANLDAEVWGSIKNELNRRGIRIKVFFIMREPVCRLESEIRMAKRRDKTIRESSADEMVLKMNRRLKNHDSTCQGNYSFTVNQIEKALTPDEALCTFYEEMFTNKGIQKLSDFFELPVSSFEPERKINTSPRPFRYPKEQLDLWRSSFDDQYEFVQSRFNFDTEKWKNSLIEELSIESQNKQLPVSDLFRRIKNRVRRILR